MTASEKEKQAAAYAAVKLIRENQVIGIGTGSTAAFAIEALATRVKEGLSIIAVSTSKQSESLAQQRGIVITDISEIKSIDITIDGADEFTEDLTLVKGGGGALFREKIVASLTREEIIIADASKKVDRLGKFPVPVEVVPFAYNYVCQQLKGISKSFSLRKKEGNPFLTDQSNYIIDIDFGLMEDPAAISRKLNDIEGILCHGIFINLAQQVIMGIGDTVVFISRKN